MEEPDRLLQIALRTKAARHLAGHLGARGATPMSVVDLAALEELRGERITKNRLEEIEQMKVAARRGELEAIIRALSLPDDWYDGLYKADRGEAVTGSLGAVLLALREGLPKPTEAPA
jgi:hypothetical protein